MHVFTFFGLEQTIRYQLRNGASADPKDMFGRTPAAEKGYELVVKLLLAQNDINIDSTGGFYAETPLSCAAAQGCDKVVKLLLAQYNIDVNSSDEFGATSLS